MKSAKWEVSTGALAAFMGARPQAGFKADLYTIDFIGSVNGGTPLLFTTADADVKVPYSGGAITYSSASVYVDSPDERAVGHQGIGLDVDTWQVKLAPALPNGSYAGATIGGLPFLQAASAGLLSGAAVTVDRAIWDVRSTGMPSGRPIAPNVGVYTKFYGAIAEVDLGRSSLAITINDPRDILNIQMPRSVFGPKCRFQLFGPGCELSPASFAVSGTVAAQVSNVLTGTVATPGGSGTYSFGRIVMTSGNNAGLMRLVRTWTQGSPASFTLIAPFPFAMASGDTFTAYPGCDHTVSSCTRFGNQANFPGMPFIPAAEVGF